MNSPRVQRLNQSFLLKISTSVEICFLITTLLFLISYWKDRYKYNIYLISWLLCQRSKMILSLILRWYNYIKQTNHSCHIYIYRFFELGQVVLLIWGVLLLSNVKNSNPLRSLFVLNISYLYIIYGFILIGYLVCNCTLMFAESQRIMLENLHNSENTEGM